MARIKAFEENTDKYEEWFERNRYAYRSELLAIKKLLPRGCEGIEIGVGSGRFAFPLGIKYGIDPSDEMIAIAEKRGIKVDKGIAEQLPYINLQFNFALMVTTICFLDNIETAFKEVYRILKPNGYFIIGFVDKQSPLGKIYQKNKNKSVFYKEATFYSVEEVIQQAKNTGFTNFEFYQTIFKSLNKIKKIEPIKQGYGRGSFVVIRCQKKE